MNVLPLKIKRQPYTLDISPQSIEIVAQGGESIIGRKIIDGQVKYLKILQNPTPERAQKLFALKRKKLDKYNFLVLPEELIYDETGRMVVGYTMTPLPAKFFPLINFKDQEWLDVINPLWILNLFLNIALGLMALHKEGIVFGDFNPMNIFVSADGEFRFIDLDSLQFDTYLCRVRMPFYSPACLRGIDFSQITYQAFTQETDWYMYASMFFEFMMGINPFSGTHPVSLSPLDRISRGEWIFDPGVIIPENRILDKNFLTLNLFGTFERYFAKQDLHIFPIDQIQEQIDTVKNRELLALALTKKPEVDAGDAMTYEKMVTSMSRKPFTFALPQPYGVLAISDSEMQCYVISNIYGNRDLDLVDLPKIIKSAKKVLYFDRYIAIDSGKELVIVKVLDSSSGTIGTVTGIAKSRLGLLWNSNSAICHYIVEENGSFNLYRLEVLLDSNGERIESTLLINLGSQPLALGYVSLQERASVLVFYEDGKCDIVDADGNITALRLSNIREMVKGLVVDADSDTFLIRRSTGPRIFIDLYETSGNLIQSKSYSYTQYPSFALHQNTYSKGLIFHTIEGGIVVEDIKSGNFMMYSMRLVTPSDRIVLRGKLFLIHDYEVFTISPRSK